MTDRERVELLPCPFCGSQVCLSEKNEYRSYSARESQSMGMGVSAGGFMQTTYVIECDCGIRFDCMDCRFLVSRWNRRHESDELRTLRALAERVERAPTANVTEAYVGVRRGKVRTFVSDELIGKRVALVALVALEDGNDR